MKFLLGDKLRCDLQVLVDTRLLVQANSGGGKSHTLRRLLEQTHGHVQQLVIDPEGEFASLRERHDYVLAARQGGDTAADPRSAKLLAERLLELGVSAIIDVYELKAHDRIRFVRLFLEALIDAKKTLWHPALVVVDEAHVFCPQQGEAESAGAVIDLATRGRKRGFCAVLATQRLSKLHKDAAAELNNKLIGRTGLDVDRKRAAEELGFTTREESLQLRALDPGEFFAFGPALSAEVQRVTVGPVETTHPKAGARLAIVAPPPTEKVRALLPKLADLPAEAEERTRTLQELQRDNATLRGQLTRLERAVPVQTAANPAGGAELRLAQATVTKLTQAVKLIEQNLMVRRSAFEKWRRQGDQILDQISRLVKQDVTVKVAVRHNEPFTVTPAPAKRAARPVATGNGDFPRGERLVLTAIAQHVDGVSREQLTVLTGYKRSTRDTYLQRLGERAYVDVAGDRVRATDTGVSALGGDFELLPVGAALLVHWRERLPEGERKILEIVVAGYPDPVGRDAISAATGYARSSRDTYLQRLGARKLVEFEGRGNVRASRMLFDG